MMISIVTIPQIDNYLSTNVTQNKIFFYLTYLKIVKIQRERHTSITVSTIKHRFALRVRFTCSKEQTNGVYIETIWKIASQIVSKSIETCFHIVRIVARSLVSRTVLSRNSFLRTLYITFTVTLGCQHLLMFPLTHHETNDMFIFFRLPYSFTHLSMFDKIQRTL